MLSFKYFNILFFIKNTLLGRAENSFIFCDYNIRYTENYVYAHRLFKIFKRLFKR